MRTTADMATFDSLDPITGEVVASFPVHTVADVRGAVERARPAAVWWAELSFDGRKKRLRGWRTLLAKRIDELAALVHRENGKPVADAIGELAIAIAHLDWAAGNAAKVLGRRRVGAGLLALNHAASVGYVPRGVVGVIGPWNYPVHTPLGSISYALAAGNAVVFKPSEYTPAIGRWLVDAFAEVVPEQPVFAAGDGIRRDRRRPVPGGRRQARVHRLDGDGQEGDGRLCRSSHAGDHRVWGQGRADRGGRRGSRGRRGRDGVGRAVQRWPDLRGRRAGVRRRQRVRAVPGPAGPCRGVDPRRRRRPSAVRADYDAGVNSMSSAGTSTTP